MQEAAGLAAVVDRVVVPKERLAAHLVRDPGEVARGEFPAADLFPGPHDLDTGVEAGAQKPNEKANARSCTPTSVSVGTTDSEGERSDAPCASALIRPSLIIPT